MRGPRRRSAARPRAGSNDVRYSPRRHGCRPRRSRTTTSTDGFSLAKTGRSSAMKALARPRGRGPGAVGGLRPLGGAWLTRRRDATGGVPDVFGGAAVAAVVDGEAAELQQKRRGAVLHARQRHRRRSLFSRHRSGKRQNGGRMGWNVLVLRVECRVEWQNSGRMGWNVLVLRVECRVEWQNSGRMG